MRVRLRSLTMFGWIAAAGVAACGDNIPPEDILASVSGSRIVLQVYGYDDGARQVDTSVLYDLRLHSRCNAQPWADGVVRCVPEADDAVYTDAACTTLIGLGVRPEKPSVVVG